MIVEACRRLAAIAPLRNYEYVGFGAMEFLDFDLFHRALGIRRMTSIEHDAPLPQRYVFNKPFKGITVLIGEASDHLPGLNWDGLRMVWLDYEKALDKEVIRDCETVARLLQQGSLLIVTVNASSDHGHRLELLTSKVGGERVPQDVTEENLARWGYARVQRSILTEVLVAVMKARADSVHLRQVFNFHYADGGKMQTLGWIVSSEGLDQTVDGCRFGEFDFVRGDETAMDIRVPILTRREIAYLNQRLPVAGRKLDVTWLDKQDQADYAALYRWYPSPRSPITSA
jgi:hypothetical protein